MAMSGVTLNLFKQDTFWGTKEFKCWRHSLCRIQKHNVICMNFYAGSNIIFGSNSSRTYIFTNMLLNYSLQFFCRFEGLLTNSKLLNK